MTDRTITIKFTVEGSCSAEDLHEALCVLIHEQCGNAVGDCTVTDIEIVDQTT